MPNKCQKIKNLETMAYNFKSIEKKWQKKWEEEGTFNASDDYTKKK